MVKTVFGGATLSDNSTHSTAAARSEIADILLANGVTTLDSARLYAGSEVAIGALPQRDSFTIDTKLLGGFGGGGSSSAADTLRDAKDSLARVGIKQFDILYLHAPDTNVPFAETLKGIADAHKAGIFRRFGLSNFTAAQVEEVHAIAKENGYPLPAVFQGNYNPVARHYETSLFPTLRKLGIHFYAYSPLAGGFLTKSTADIDAGAGRFNAKALGGLYVALYDKPSLRDALAKWNAVAEKEGVSKAELAYRWVAYHSALQGDEDGVIFGASSVRQVEQTAQALKKGKLSDEAVKAIEEIWESVKDEAPTDNFEVFSKASAERAKA